VLHSNSWTIFTTNYDLILETFWRGIKEKNLSTGFTNGFLDPKLFLYSSKYGRLKRNEHPVMRLVKLHGSVSWLLNKNGKISGPQIIEN
jgi:hypothetical protein